MNTLREFLDYMADKFGDADAYMWMEGSSIRSKSFASLRADSFGIALKLYGTYGAGCKIALIGDMSYPWIAAYYGIMNSSCISVPMDTKLSAPELEKRLDFADVTVVFLSRRYESLREPILTGCRAVKDVLWLEEYTAEPLPEFPPALPEPDPDALSSLMFTSGTSGDGLKAAMITQRAILADVTGPVPLCVPGDRLLSLLPIHHCFEIFVGQMKYLYLGATICVNDSMANLIPNLTRFGITIVVAVPALANMLAAFIAQGLKTHTIDEVKKMLGGRLRRITIGGASASKEVIETLGLAGITIFVGYGLTESAGGCLANCDASLRPLEAGAPYVDGMEMKLEDGELCLKGPMIMQGYYKAPELTERVMENGWFHTGDLAEITDEGYVIIHGRKDNMIKTQNGEKIYPEVWESRLSMIGGVAAAMVADVDDHLTAILFLKEDSPEKREAVIGAVDAMNAHLPGYEKILDVRFREKPFPMTTSLKIRRKEVMKELEGERRETVHVSAQNNFQTEIMEKVMQVMPGIRQIGIDDNLYELGLDSLSTISLAILLDCDPEAIYASKTVRRLEERLTGRDVRKSSENALKIPGINHFITGDTLPSVEPGQIVLLTGASGFLGAHLLNELTRQGRRVICLVRSRKTLDRALDYYGFSGENPDMEVVTGDITRKDLGLEASLYDSLCRRVNSVVHAAALVSHVGSEEASTKVNVEGTKEVIRFCRKGSASLFHISSYAVSGFHTDLSLTEDVLDIGQEIGLNPYIQTKYQAEEQVLMARGEGLPSTIFRIGNLSPRAFDGRFQINPDENGMAAQLRAFQKMGIFPESMGDVPFDRTPVDLAARAAALLIKEDGTGHIWHIMNPHVTYLDKLTHAKPVSDEEFARRLSLLSSDRDTAILSVYYRMKQNGFNSRFDMSKTQRELARLGFAWK